ncbi:MAG TPA: aminoacyl-tRNA hydrolase [Acholeplasma sp.]|nr:aminoacyl-tRNA hydrolase [Acholeplasma sp.]
MKLIVGLGNPGREYVQTRHNVGFMMIDKLAYETKTEFKVNEKLKSALVKTKIENEDVILAKPLTYMNLSGEAVVAISNFYKIETKDILVISDDIALPLGKIRFRNQGTHGGQKGLKHILEQFKTNDIKRLRIGIGFDPKYDKADYVLSRFTKNEIDQLMMSFDTCYVAIKEWISTDNFNIIMSKYN